jgi:hypothetical protein
MLTDPEFTNEPRHSIPSKSNSVDDRSTFNELSTNPMKPENVAFSFFMEDEISSFRNPLKPN